MMEILLQIIFIVLCITMIVDIVFSIKEVKLRIKNEKLQFEESMASRDKLNELIDTMIKDQEEKKSEKEAKKVLTRTKKKENE